MVMPFIMKILGFMGSRYQLGFVELAFLETTGNFCLYEGEMVKHPLSKSRP
jgi:hypothetical protein